MFKEGDKVRAIQDSPNGNFFKGEIGKVDYIDGDGRMDIVFNGRTWVYYCRPQFFEKFNQRKVCAKTKEYLITQIDILVLTGYETLASALYILLKRGYFTKKMIRELITNV